MIGSAIADPIVGVRQVMSLGRIRHSPSSPSSLWKKCSYS
ncbi:hypothetical protein MC7420_4856 [Coleofasciculus chthonoplastes PCC 7420]|uniref:Uncharacterized protein n=1 Tax=Coleofasciculus chthonoplastes PCC 7420 TaxID=118168 RepID=B4VNQ9_9CYAN|nr:hypothetical protein MC7420_4856 [Coleofasciculus chthonoplastes PCC 7420]